MERETWPESLTYLMLDFSEKNKITDEQLVGFCAQFIIAMVLRFPPSEENFKKVLDNLLRIYRYELKRDCHAMD